MITDGVARPSPASATSGDVIAGFTVESELGRGANSDVYRVHKAGRDGAYALKILAASERSEQDLAAFRREAALLASVNHANLTTIHEVGAADGRPYLVMDLVEGASLASVLTRGALSPEQVISLARDISGPLAALHRRGLVHRDVKPDNLMVLPSGTARLIDFSLASRETGDHTGPTVGTLAYSSPEQSRMLRRPVDQRSDLYSLGVVLFECLAGAPPFSANDVADLLRMHAVIPPEDLATLVPGIPPGLATVVATLLAKDPDDRYQTGEELAADLDLLAADPDAALTVRGRTASSGGNTSVPLIGRVRELQQLTARWKATRAGAGRSCVIRATGGGGKSRLATELAAQVVAAGGLVLHGKSSRDDSAPLTPLRTAFDAYLRRVDNLPAEDRARELSWIRAATEPAGGILDGLIPALPALLGSPASEPDGTVGADQFTLAVVDVLAGLARESGGLLLYVDDVQWLDGGTGQVLSQLAEVLSTLPLMVLATARDDPDSTEAANAVIASLGTSVSLDLTLKPLDDADVAELVRTAMPGLAPDPELARLLNVRGHGSPFVIQEYLLAIVDAGLLLPFWGTWALDTEALDTLELPQEAIGLVLARARNLGPETRELLVTAACIGVQFDPELVAAVHGVDIDVVLTAIAQATTRGLTEPRGGGRYAFVHDRIREALSEQIDAGALAGLHHRIAEALAGLPATGDAERVYQLARHYISGGIDPAGDAGTAGGRVFAACWAAGQQALNDHAAANAVAFLRHAAPGGTTNGRFLTALGTAYSRNGEFTMAVECLDRALVVETDPMARARTLILLSTTHRTTFRLEQAMTAVEQGLAEIGAPLPAGRLRLTLSTIVMFLSAVGMHWTGWRLGSARTADRERYSMITELHEMGASIAEQSAHLRMIFMHTARLLYWGNRIGSGARYVCGQTMYGFYTGSMRLTGVARRAFARAEADSAAHEPAMRALIDVRRGVADYLGYRDGGEAFISSVEQHGHRQELGDYTGCLALFIARAIARGQSAEAQRWLELGQRRLALGSGEVSPMLFDLATVLAAMGRPVEAADEFRRANERLTANYGSTVMRMRGQLSQLIVLTEQSEFGEPFDRVVSDLHVLYPRIRMVPRPWDYQFLVVTGRLAQCRQAEGATPARLAAARAAVRKLERSQLGGEQRVRARIGRADLLVLEGEPRKALAVLDGGDPLDRVDAPSLAYETARVRARALLALGATDEGHRAVHLARGIAEENGWPHRAAWIGTEFGVSAGYAASGQSAQAGMTRSASMNLTRSRSVTPTFSPIDTSTGISFSGAAGLDRQRLNALEEVGAAASRVLDPGELARIALDQTIRVLSAERAYLFLTGADGRLMPHLGRNAAGEDIGELTGYSASLVERVHQTGQPLVITGSEEGAALGAQSVVLHGLRSIMLAPLQLEGRLLGVVYLDSQVAKGIFDTDDVGLLVALTNHIATSLETARAAQLEISMQTARQQRDLADTLRRALEDMASILEPPEVLAGLLRWTTSILSCEHAWLLTADSDDDVCVLSELNGDGRLTQHALAAHSGTALAHIATTVTDQPNLLPAELHARLTDAASWLAVPLHARPGVLLLSSRHAGSRVGEQAEIASALVAQGMTAYDRARLFAQVQALSVIDELTGIANRRQFMHVAERDIATALRAGRPLSVLMIDIDHFKLVNDTHGHPTGDDVIRTVAARLAAEVRQTDLVGRYGGEEFAIILQDAELGSTLPERLRACIAEHPIETQSGPLTVTVSIGVSHLQPDDATLKDLLARADQALYEAKRSGRNRVCNG
ncbi:diguanylate cyclase [Actinoplanes sp. NPDC089786]|uniref:diguanylate cyclase n=1 Tax=Actinoplanes sp. NPDC089786 TaxID=3155185 RepID=UPI003432F610